MEIIVFWAIINALVGAAIGQSKNAVGQCIAICILLGPIGWIIAFVIEGDVRKCPFCAENVQPAALVCPHCRRDLTPARPQLQPAEPEPASRPVARKGAGPDPEDVKRVQELLRRYEEKPPEPDHKEQPYRL
jgi:hypothetical protein